MTTNSTEHLEEYALWMKEDAIIRIFSHPANKDLMDTLLTYHENPELWDSIVFDDKIDTLYERRLLASQLARILWAKSGTTSEEIQWYGDQSGYYKGLYSTLYSLTKWYKPSV